MSQHPLNLHESFHWSYALSKMLPSAYELGTTYGALPLDEEMRDAIARALRPILERRLKLAEGHGKEGC